MVDNQEVELSLWDTAGKQQQHTRDLISPCIPGSPLSRNTNLYRCNIGQEEFDRLRTLSYADTHAVILCFSVDSRDSLENIPNRWLSEVHQYCPEAKILLVALKCDLRDNDEVLKRKNIEPVLYEEVCHV